MSDAIYSLGFTLPDPVRMRFADGEFVIPPHAVEEAGGPEALEENKAALAQITFEDFMRAVAEQISGSIASNVQNKLVGDHLRGHRRW